VAAIRLGALLRVADRATLGAFLRERPPAERPQPEQMACAGRSARVVAVQLDRDGAPRYRLAGLPGEWRAEWLRPR
jgi:hypothetical protein